MPFLRLALQTVDPPALPCVWSCSECQAEFALWNESIESVSKEQIDQSTFSLRFTAGRYIRAYSPLMAWTTRLRLTLSRVYMLQLQGSRQHEGPSLPRSRVAVPGKGKSTISQIRDQPLTQDTRLPAPTACSRARHPKDHR